MYRTPELTALLIALLLKRTAKRRIRFSVKTFLRLADRERKFSSFVHEVQKAAKDIGVVLIELNRGGFGATWASPLEGADSVLAKHYVPAAERKKLTERAILKELGLSETQDEDEAA